MKPSLIFAIGLYAHAAVAAPTAAPSASAAPTASAAPSAVSAAPSSVPLAPAAPEPTCVEHIPEGKSRPPLTEQFPSKGVSGFTTWLEVTLEHAKGEN
ncbi:MAG TPA: hypothetical protein VHO25_15215, partial [Polyangiaceae bacterium]|nr:hypothetical protein [Polyangiaceae bacterium]